MELWGKFFSPIFKQHVRRILKTVGASSPTLQLIRGLGVVNLMKAYRHLQMTRQHLVLGFGLCFKGRKNVVGAIDHGK